MHIYLFLSYDTDCCLLVGLILNDQNRKAGQNPPRIVAPTEEEEEEFWMMEAQHSTPPLESSWVVMENLCLLQPISNPGFSMVTSPSHV